MGELVSRILFHNNTELDDAPLLALCHEAVAGWAVGTVVVRVRYSRSADFSGTCIYRDRRILINLGRHVKYPYRLSTHLAKTKTVGRRWFKPIYSIELDDAYQLVSFVFLHELYHLLVKCARRNTRQKESMCDRFAARFLVDRFNAVVRGPRGESVARQLWDYQDLEGFVEAARDRRVLKVQAKRRLASSGAVRQEQLLLPL